MRIAVIGSGYVGLVVAACFAELGHQVVCVDNDLTKISALSAGETLIREDYLPELLGRHRGRNLVFSSDLTDAIRESLVIVIAVGTPAAATGEVDLSYVESVTREIARAADGYKLIVEKSTVPVYTNAWIHRSMVLNGRRPGSFDVVSNPEFLSAGTAVRDFLYPDRVVIGVNTRQAASTMREVYRPLLDGSYSQRGDAVPRPAGVSIPPFYLETTAQSAEIIKHASNAFLAMKISFINAVANIAEAAGADIEDICKGIGSDSRIGTKFLRPGIGYGGSCFPKDIAAFQSVARECNYQFRLLDEIRSINEDQIQRYLKKVRTALWTLKNKRLGVLGLAFKSSTDDVRESPAIHVIKILLKEGCEIIAFDPAAMERAHAVLGNTISYATDPYDAASGADALLILTEWKEFAELDLRRIRELLNYPIVLDGRNLYSPEEMAKAGLNYYSVGRPTLEVFQSMVLQQKAR